MSIGPLPSLEYLLECSDKSLHELELNCLNRSQQCMKAARKEMEEAVAQREAAGVARFFIEHRPCLLELAQRTIEAHLGQTSLPFPTEVVMLLSESDDTSDKIFSRSNGKRPLGNALVGNAS